MPIPWERQDTDTKGSYAAFVDYCEMGVKRSLRGLHEYYLKQSSSNPQAKQPTKKESTLFTWSLTGNWQERVQAYDADQLARRTAAQQAAITQLIDNELEDYDVQLQKWGEVFAETRSYQRHKRYEERDDDGNKTGKVIETVEMNISDWHQLSKWRDEIAKQGRRALGLPDRITEGRKIHSGDKENPIVQRNVNINIPAETVADAGNILDYLESMGAIPSEASENGHNAEDNGVHGADTD